MTVRLAMLVDTEYVERDTRKLNRLIKAAKLKYPNASMVAIDFRANRQLDRSKLDRKDLFAEQSRERHGF